MGRSDGHWLSDWDGTWEREVEHKFISAVLVRGVGLVSVEHGAVRFYEDNGHRFYSWTVPDDLWPDDFVVKASEVVGWKRQVNSGP